MRSLLAPSSSPVLLLLLLPLLLMLLLVLLLPLLLLLLPSSSFSMVMQCGLVWSDPANAGLGGCSEAHGVKPFDCKSSWALKNWLETASGVSAEAAYFTS